MFCFWAAAFLQPQRHRLALHCLTAERGYEVYAPQIVGRPIWRGQGWRAAVGASVRQLCVRAHRRAVVAWQFYVLAFAVWSATD